MASSSLNLSTTTAVAATNARPLAIAPAPAPATAPRPPQPHPQSHPPQQHQLFPIQPTLRPQPAQNPNSSNPQLQPPPPPPQGMLYPAANAGRGFIHHHSRPLRPPDLAPGAYHPRGVPLAYRHHSVVGSASPRAALHPHLDGGLAAHAHHLHNLQQQHLMRQHPVHLQHHHHLNQPPPTPPPLPQQQQHYAGGVGSAPVRGIPVAGQLKVASSPTPVSDSNGYKNLRDRSKDDNVIMVRDRKVRISDGASLYALCRSWLRNGIPEESQQHYGDGVKSLPRPLPIPIVDTDSPKESKDNKEVEVHEDEESVDHLSPEDLLKRHVRHAKKVRARLREERLKRIARYKGRLALLLPPQVEAFQR